MKNVMVDLETFGTTPGMAIRSLAAVEFEIDGATGRSFYANIDHASCEAVGLMVDPKTVEWWSRQSKAAQDALLVDPKPLREVLLAFGKWLPADAKPWSHGAAFDMVLLEAAYRACRFSGLPWKFFNIRDTRTVYDLFDLDVRDVPRVGTHHNALDDARFQIDCVVRALRKGQAPAVAPAEDRVFG